MENELPTRRGMRLYQNLDVSSEARQPNDGDALVFDKSRGVWLPRSVQVSIEPGDIPDGSITEPRLANLSVSTRTVQAGAITSPKLATDSVTDAKILAGAVTDAKVGNRTVDDGVAVTTSTAENTGTLTQLFSRVTSRIRQIIGGTSWRSAVPISLTQLANHRARHYTGGADPLTPANIGAATSTHTHTAATQAAAGFLSTADKLKLDTLGGFWATTNNASLRLTTSFQYVPNMTVVLDRVGTWLVMATLVFSTQFTLARSANWNVEAQFLLNGAGNISTAYVDPPTINLHPKTLTMVAAQTSNGSHVIDVRVRETYFSDGTNLSNTTNQRFVAVFLG